MYSNHLGRKAGILLTVVTALLATGCAPPPASLTESDVEAIRASTEAYGDAVSAGDWAATGWLYTEDAVLMPPNAPAAMGRDAIQETMASFPPITAFSIVADDIQGVGDLAYVRGTFSITLQAGDNVIEDHGKYLEIRRRQADGSWPITVDIWNSDVPQPAVAPTQESEGEDM